MANLDTWNKVCRPPATALKQIGGGRLKGMTDINPQWRLQAMTEIYGECGVGWYYDIVSFWTVDSPNTQEMMVFSQIKLYTKRGEHWSAPISGIGGSTLVSKEKAGLYANDEAYKMATTDALSVAMKQLGFGAEIYMGRWDGTKYKDNPTTASAKPITKDVWDSLSPEKQKELQGIVDTVRSLLDSDMALAVGHLHDIADADEKTAIWSRFDSKERAAIKAHMPVKE